MGTAGKKDGMPIFFKQKVLFVVEGVVPLFVRAV